MARKRTMKESELCAVLDRALSNSSQFVDNKLSRERRDVLKYYRGELPQKANSGDASYVSMDVFDAVDSMRALVLEAYSAHPNVVKFSPDGPHDVADSKQATDYCRHVVFRKNDGEKVFYDALTDGLMARYAVAKVYVEEEDTSEVEEFEGVTEDELGAMLEDVSEDDLEISEVDGQLFKGTITKGSKQYKICINPIPPEEFLISNSADSVQGAKFVVHRTRQTRTELLKQGYPKKVVDKIEGSDSSFNDDYQEKDERFDPVDTWWGHEEHYQDAQKMIDVYEFYINIDINQNGVTELRRIVKAGSKVLENEAIKRIPFATFVPLPVPHTFFGENFAWNVVSTQKARTVLMRGILNHTVMTNNPRWMVQNGALANPKELMDNRLGGIVNTRRIDGIAPLPQHPLNPYVFNAIQLLDEDKEDNTGLSKVSQGLNKDALSKQNSQAMVEQMVTLSQQRTKIIARQFGKFVRELYLLVYDTARDYIDAETIQNDNEEFVGVNPSEWEPREYVTLSMTLGYNEMEREAVRLAEIDQYLSADPRFAMQYGPEQRYKLVSESLEKRGIPDVASILLPPSQAPQPEPDPAQEAQLAQLQAQVKLTEAQAQAAVLKAQTDHMKASTEKMRVQLEMLAKKTELELQETELAHDMWVDEEELRLSKTAQESKAIYAPNS